MTTMLGDNDNTERWEYKGGGCTYEGRVIERQSAMWVSI